MMIQLTSGFCAGPGDKSKMGFRSPRLAKSHWAAYLSPWSRAGAPEPLEKDASLVVTHQKALLRMLSSKQLRLPWCSFWR